VQQWNKTTVVQSIFSNCRGGCDDDQEEEVDSDDMEYTEDAIDNMILEFSGDLYKHESKIKCLFVFFTCILVLPNA
jgi:hypothetical protein